MKVCAIVQLHGSNRRLGDIAFDTCRFNDEIIVSHYGGLGAQSSEALLSVKSLANSQARPAIAGFLVQLKAGEELDYDRSKQSPARITGQDVITSI